MLPRCYRLRVGSIPKVPQGLLFKLLNFPGFYKFILISPVIFINRPSSRSADLQLH
jgi:hypothetical protein